MKLDSFSFGGGQQSTACLVLAAQGHLDCGLFVFSHVGEDSERKKVLDYLYTYSIPFAEKHGIELLVLRRHKRNGEVETLMQRMTNDNKSIPIPYRTKKDGKPMSRSCTADFKTRVIDKELRRRGFSEDNPAVVGLGISMEEMHRAAPGRDPLAPAQIRTYPLLCKTPLDPYTPGLELRRHECVQIVLDAGLPEPPSSACWFCPNHDVEMWRRQKRNEPDDFAASCKLEQHLTERRGAPVFLTRYGKPLADVVDDQLVLVGMDGCESGRCMT